MAKHKERKQLGKEIERMIEFMQDSSDAIEIVRIDIVVEYIDVDGVTQIATNAILDKNIEK